LSSTEQRGIAGRKAFLESFPTPEAHREFMRRMAQRRTFLGKLGKQVLEVVESEYLLIPKQNGAGDGQD